MSGRLTPSPKADVETMHRSAPSRNAASTRARSSRLKHAPTEHARQRDGLVARVHVDDAFLARGDDGDEPVLARCEVAPVVDRQVRAHGVVHQDLVDGKHASDDIGDLGGRGRRGGEDAGAAELPQHRGKLKVGTPISARGLGDVMGLVHDDESDPARSGELVGMDRQELGGREDDVHRAR